MRRLRVVYIAHDTADYGGSALSLLNMISSLGDAIEPVVVCRRQGHIVDVLRERGVECIVHDFTLPTREYSATRQALLFPRLLAFHRRQYRRDIDAVCAALGDRRVDIVHANNSINHIGAGLARRLGARLVWHVREYLTLDHNIKIFGGRGWLRRMINRSDAVIANSTAIYRYWRMRPVNGHVIGNAVKKMSDAADNPRRDKYILFCAGMLSEKKGTFFAAEAFLRSDLPHRGYRLRMLGKATADTVGRLERLAAEAGVPGCIETPGFADDLRAEYLGAAAYVMASEREALGRVTIEAMFYGCPVVARATGGTTDIVKDGVTGHLFIDIEGCAALLRDVVDTDQSAITARATEYVCANFSEESYRDKILALYRSLTQ